MRVDIPSLSHTAKLGQAMAAVWAARPDLPLLLLLHGQMGAGKTTLTRFMVESLPGGDLAEVSSPSFTLCNSYPTRPPVLHFDLYRLEEGQYDDTLPEALYEAEYAPTIILVEWPERMDKSFLPDSYVYCRLTESENNRRAFFEGYGEAAAAFLSLLKAEAEKSGLSVAG